MNNPWVARAMHDIQDQCQAHVRTYTLFQNGGQFIILLFACLLALFASFSLQNCMPLYFVHVDEAKRAKFHVNKRIINWLPFWNKVCGLSKINCVRYDNAFVVIFFKTMYNKTIMRFGFCDIANNQGLG